jgi:hypothetical protein
MALVTLTISSTPAAPDNIADALSGGSFGADLTQAANGSYAPLVGEQGSNAGAKSLFLKHDSDVDPITNVSFYIAPFTGTYGGPPSGSPTTDFEDLRDQGRDDAGGYATNSDGLSSGLHMDMSYSVSSTNQFAPARETTGQKRIFGKTYNLVQMGVQNNPISLHPDAAFYYNNLTKVEPSAPEEGKIGKSSDAVLGNRAEVRLRYCLPSTAAIGGILQWSFVTLFSYTA